MLELEAGKCGEEGRGSRTPPSRESETWILVSFVSRLMRAVRAAVWCSERRVCDSRYQMLMVDDCSVIVEGVEGSVKDDTPWSLRLAK